MNMAYRILVTDPINDAGLKLLKSAGNLEMDVVYGLSAAELREGIAHYDTVITRSGTALSFINLDSEAPETVLVELRSLEPIIEVKQVNL